LSEVQLRVLDSRQRDVARGIARINQRTMQKLGVSSGNVIEILGKKKTSAAGSKDAKAYAFCSVIPEATDKR